MYQPDMIDYTEAEGLVRERLKITDPKRCPLRQAIREGALHLFRRDTLIDEDGDMLADALSSGNLLGFTVRMHDVDRLWPDPNAPRGRLSEGAVSDSLSTRERRTLLKLLLGLAMDKFKFLPDGGRSSAAANISAALDRQGLKVSEDTVLKYLREAVDLGLHQED